jgi:hypothetical protein
LVLWLRAWESALGNRRILHPPRWQPQKHYASVQRPAASRCPKERLLSRTRFGFHYDGYGRKAAIAVIGRFWPESGRSGLEREKAVSDIHF